MLRPPHPNYSNGHAAAMDHSPNSSHLSVHSEVSDPATGVSGLVARTHKQQTTQQVTTVTKVVREVKHLGGNGTTTGGGNGVSVSGIDGQPVDYVTMPLDVQHLGPDGQPIDFVAMPLGMYPR